MGASGPTRCAPGPGEPGEIRDDFGPELRILLNGAVGREDVVDVAVTGIGGQEDDRAAMRVGGTQMTSYLPAGSGLRQFRLPAE